ncbi:MAG: hypothetical protein ACKOYH_09735 [Cyanobium sp.]
MFQLLLELQIAVGLPSTGAASAPFRGREGGSGSGRGVGLSVA